MEKTGFFAYPSIPEDCELAIEAAIVEINTDPSIKVESWKSLQIGGKLIISEILKKIESSDFFCADITGLNENVLFELGFAIGKRKPVLIIQDISISNSYNRFKEFIILTSIGYHTYTNSKNIKEAFFKESPHSNNSVLLDSLITKFDSTANKHAVLYLKSQIDTNYTQFIVDTLDSLKLPVIIDDANEDKIQPLSWYLSNILTVPAVMVEFSQIFRTGHEIQNAKCSFVGGLALGLGLKLQMIAPKPYPNSIDYQEYLKKYTNIETCSEAITPFLKNLKSEIAQLFVQPKKIHPSLRAETNLQKVKFGESIAEHESNDLSDYYVSTTQDENLIKSEYNIVLGRKGSGKTATFYFLQNVFGKDVRNMVVSIKPINFEIDGLVELIKKIDSEFTRGFIIEAIWKFLIYTEIAKGFYHLIKEKPLYAIDQKDRDIIDYIDENKNIVLTDFSTRLEQELENLSIIENVHTQTIFKEKISETLHEQVIGKLKEMITDLMKKKRTLLIIVDNLDKNWRKGKNVEITSKFILGLLGVIGRIVKELRGNGAKAHAFQVKMIVLLRSDIFAHILPLSREPDKLEYTRLRWDDPEVLFRVIDTRIDQLSEDGIYSGNFWIKFICQRVNGLSTKKYILSCIIPRPRDLIFFLNSAKGKAISRGHAMILEDDLTSAYSEYSYWVFQSVLVENGVTIAQMESFLYNMIGESTILTTKRIEELMNVSNINTDQDAVKHFVDYLCSLSFLGREVREGEFEYEYDFENNRKIQILSDKLGSDRYRIHNAFIPFLECSVG